ncbi:retrotransposon gag family protein, partial [Alteromonas stellipolaris]|uniref:retrotransposon gag family protein n=1 Tax=Alteromonas stellipolaris TaxID=233316 RepID=UPI001D4898DA
AADQVEVIQIQLTDVARTWWLSEEAKYKEPATWKQFTDGFYDKFFPKIAQREMREQFMKLKQWDRTVDQYAAEFTRLSRFAP